MIVVPLPNTHEQVLNGTSSIAIVSMHIIIIEMAIKSLLLLSLLSLCLSLENLYFSHEITIPQNESFFIADPLTFARVVHRKIVSQTEPLICNFVTPQLQLTILAQYRLSNLNSLKKKFIEQKEKIISASFDWRDKVWLLTNDGSILQLRLSPLNQQFIIVKTYYSDKALAASGKFFGEIYCLGDHVFVKYRGLFYSASFRDNSWQLEYQYSVQPVTRVKISKDELYFMTHLNLVRIQKDKTYKQLARVGKSYFKDFDVSNNKLLALTSIGIFAISKANFNYEGMQKIPHIDQAKKLRISENCMIIYFKRMEEEIILEYYLQKLLFQNISTLNQRRYLTIDGSYVREGKLHRQYRRVENILMNGKYAIVQQKFQFSFLEINLLTKNPFPLQQNQITFKKYNVLGLQWQNQQIFMFEDNKVKLYSIQNAFFKNDLFRSALSCLGQQESTASLEVEYKGMCSSDNFDKTSWECEQLVKYSLNIQSNEFFELLSKLQVFLLLSLLLAVLASAFLYYKIRKDVERVKREQEKPKSQELTELKQPETREEK